MKQTSLYSSIPLDRDCYFFMKYASYFAIKEEPSTIIIWVSASLTKNKSMFRLWLTNIDDNSQELTPFNVSFELPMRVSVARIMSIISCKDNVCVRFQFCCSSIPSSLSTTFPSPNYHGMYDTAWPLAFTLTKLSAISL